jgi:mRNA interferase MazF
MSAPRLQWSIFEIDRDGGVGADRAGPRPVLVVSRDSANAALPIVTVLPLIDRKPGRRIYPNEVLLPSQAAQLRRDVITMAHQIRTIPKKLLNVPVGTVDDPDLRAKVRRALQVQLHLDQ